MTEAKQQTIRRGKTQKLLQAKRARRAKRTRAKVRGTQEKPRLTVFRSNKYVYAQLVDDSSGKTLAASFGLIKDASTVGQTLAKNALTKNVSRVVFDKGAYTYHGKIKELADAARKQGLTF